MECSDFSWLFSGHFFDAGFFLFFRNLSLRMMDFAFEIFTGALELAHAFSEAACQFGDLLGPEEQEDHDKNNDPFRSLREAKGEWRVHVLSLMGGLWLSNGNNGRSGGGLSAERMPDGKRQGIAGEIRGRCAKPGA